MKAERDHRVPLADRALAIIAEMEQVRCGPYIFEGYRSDRHLSTGAFDALLERMKVKTTTHGFRSSFRDWAGDCTEFPREVAEAALAHAVGDKAEQAYRRGDALAKRRALMDAWADYLKPIDVEVGGACCDPKATEGDVVTPDTSTGRS